MKKYTGKTVEGILKEISTEQDVKIEDIEYKVIEQSGFSIFSKVEIEAFTYKDCIESIKTYITDILEAMELDVEIEVEYDGSDYRVNLNTNNNGLIIGVNGKNLYALETLTKQTMSNLYHRRFFISLDVNEYFKEKEEKLKRFAYKIAAEVGKTKVDVKLDPMPNYDRKVIHKVLKEVHYVTTKSFGEGKERHLVVQYDLENDLKHNERKKNEE
ncbi:spoIIIJ-associated protein [Bacilli bacterium PM5-3]|nr:spoIIIJ-associated protein [Bacilli bacterium PM5-3]MDH6604180.1 spoIIIJ-associated protein [Bacilli bacterium PM5-9]